MIRYSGASYRVTKKTPKFAAFSFISTMGLGKFYPLSAFILLKIVSKMANVLALKSLDF